MKNKLERNPGEWALVTGSSSGIGKEFAIQLARQGYHIVLLARRREKLEEIAKKLQSEYGVETAIVQQDLTADDLETTLNKIVGDYKVRVVISNAGAAIMAAFVKAKHQQLQNMVDLNVKAQLTIAHFFANYFLKNSISGGLLMVSTSAALQGVPYSANYSAAKAYVLNLGEALNYELKPNNINVTVLVPGPTKAPGLTDRTDADLSKMPMKPQEVNALVKEGLKGLRKNKPVVIGGGMNKIMAGMGKRLLSRKMNVTMWGKLMKPMVYNK